MPRYNVKLGKISTWEKVIMAKSMEEAVQKAEKQSDSWERRLWVHFTQDAWQPDVELVEQGN